MTGGFCVYAKKCGEFDAIGSIRDIEQWNEREFISVKCMFKQKHCLN